MTTSDTDRIDIREKCGLCGVIGGERLLQRVYLGLHSLQHRGQEAAGVMVASDGHCRLFKGPGLVDSVFAGIPKPEWDRGGSHCISHVRYSTAGGSLVGNAQPLMVEMSGHVVGIAHNGTICNAGSLKRQLQDEGALLQTRTDTELVLHLMSRGLMKRHSGDPWEALKEALCQLRGAYSLLLMDDRHMVAVRDPLGFRPLAIGAFPDGGYIVASETIAFDVTGADYLREVEPGEMVVWDRDGTMTSHRFVESRRRAHCIFEHVYFARPGSRVFGDSVYEVRRAMGRRLARDWPVDADLVVPVPDSGVYAGLGFAEESGIPFDMGLSRNHYVGRTFIDPGTNSRREMVMRKLQPITEALRGKRICLIEDSIVRGSTSRARVETLRDVGVKEVHMRVSCPPHRFGCYFGIDFPDRDELIANRYDVADLARQLHLDSLQYLSREGMLSCVRAYGPTDYCTACFDGNYPTIPEDLESGTGDRGGVGRGKE